MEEDTERRIGVNEMKTDIALIKQKAQFIEEKIESVFIELAKVNSSLNTKDLLTKADLDSHITQDRWAFGIVMTLLLCVLGKLIHG